MEKNHYSLHEDLRGTGTETIDACILGCGGGVRRDRQWEAWLSLRPPYGIRRCDVCSLRWLSPRPDAEGLKVIYSSRHYFHSGGVTDFGQYAMQREEHFSRRVSQLKQKGVKTILDYGAATGGFVAVALRAGLDAVGVEFSEAARSEAESVHGITLLAPGDESINNCEFDAVHMNHVLEHMPDPVAHLKWCSNLIRMGGTLVIEVPRQFENDADRLRRIVGRGGTHEEFNAFSLHHTYFFTPRTLGRACDLAGFEVTSMRTLITPNPQIGSRVRSLAERILAWSAKTRLGGDSIEMYAMKPGSVPT